MALNLSGYTDPGANIGEVVTPAAISVSTVPDILAIVAVGDRNKRSINEAVVRGQVFEEALTVASSPPHTATLVNRGDRRISNTTIRKTLSGQETVLPDAAISYPAATLLGTQAGPFDISTNKAIGFQMDSGQAITIEFEYNAAPASVPTINGTHIVVQFAFSGTAGDAATRQDVASAINDALSNPTPVYLAALTALGYGSAYSLVATDGTTGIQLTSPITTPSSDVKTFAAAGLDATTLLGFTVASNDKASTLVEIDATYWDASATWEMDYVSVETTTDALVNTATVINKVGSFANVTSFTSPTDYLLTGGDIDWSPDTAAAITGTAGTYDVSTNNNIKIALDGKAAVEILLDGLVSPPLDYADPGTPATASAAELANNINAVLSTAAGYGPEYSGVATDSGGTIVLTSPTQGVSSSIELSAPSSNDATTELFGISTSQLPYTVVGTGSVPVVGVIYFITYGYDRPSSEYNVPIRHFSEDQMTQAIGPVSVANILATYGQISFDNGAPSLFTCQIDDATTTGSPTVNEVNAAIDGLEKSTLITDVVVADTRLNVQTHLMAHIENQSSPTEKNYRSGWFGMPANTVVGDKDTPDSFVYRAAVTLQVAPDSPSRGRLLLLAPTGVNRTITLEDGSEATLSLDSTAVACATAGRHTSFTSPAISLASKNIVGFDVNTFPTYLKAERAQLASNGVLVITEDGGRLTILDPVTTEAGGGNLPQFKYRSLTSQKDNVTRAVTRVIETNLRGIVPDDLADFVFDIKTFTGQTLVSLIGSGAIGPYRDANLASRDIDLSRDVQAEQNRSDPTKYSFRYFYFGRYPALRFEGEYSVDNPFFST
jgi:hypothetical protein